VHRFTQPCPISSATLFCKDLGHCRSGSSPCRHSSIPGKLVTSGPVVSAVAQIGGMRTEPSGLIGARERAGVRACGLYQILEPGCAGISSLRSRWRMYRRENPGNSQKKAAQVCVLTLHTPSTARARAATAQGKLRLVAAATRARLARTSRPSPVLASQHHSIELVCAAAPHTTNLGTSRTRNNIFGPTNFVEGQPGPGALLQIRRSEPRSFVHFRSPRTLDAHDRCRLRNRPP